MESNFLQKSISEFILFLKEKDIKRFFFVFDQIEKTVIPSHPELANIADYLQNKSPDFEEHEGIFVELNSEFDTLLGAFIHRTKRGQAAGGVRYWEYNSVENFLTDGMRLAKGMTHKNALAGLWWGGGKGVMTYNPAHKKDDKTVREKLYKAYGKFMTSLNGCYVTAEDVGTSVEDMANIFSETRFTTCIPNYVGGSGNPSIPTAKGVVAGMEAGLEFIGESSLEGKTVAVQGLGHVAVPLLKYLFQKGVAKVTACDIFPDAIENANNEFGKYNFQSTLVTPNDFSILESDCDILAPCATGAIINSETIPKIKAKIICGAANNQLKNPIEDDLALLERGIIYIPDFLTNRMGIVNCADEQAGYVVNDPLVERHLSKDWEFSIHQTALRVLEKSKRDSIPSGKVALDLANKLSLEVNPIYGHRGVQIIDSLRKNGWAKKG